MQQSSVSAVENKFFKTQFEYKNCIFLQAEQTIFAHFPTQTCIISTNFHTHKQKEKGLVLNLTLKASKC